MKKSYLAVITVIALASMYAGFRVSNAVATEPKKNAVQAAAAVPAAGKSFFDYTLKNVAGEPQALQQWKGKFLVVNFWATWCQPCVKEMPELNELSLELKNKNIEILGIGIDAPSQIREFTEKLKIHYPILMAGMEGSVMATELGNKKGGLPFTILIDKNGKTRKTYLGRLNIQELKTDITKYSEEK